MRQERGFALALSLLFVMFLTLFGFSLLLLAGSYYSSTRNLFEKENARLACDQAVRLLVDRHNMENTEPRFFYNAGLWNEQQLTPFLWNSHEIGATLEEPWSKVAVNLLRVASRKGPFAAAQKVELRQRRLEDYALYLNASQKLTGPAALFGGPVYVEDGLALSNAGNVFQDTVQGAVEPESNATFRRRNLQRLEYPQVAEVLQQSPIQQQAGALGKQITARNPLFWRGTQYEVDLDRFILQQQPDKHWKIQYSGIDLGLVTELILWFDDTVAVSQGALPAVFAGIKPQAPIYIASANDVQIQSHMHALESSANKHPLALIAGGAVHVGAGAPAVLSLEALVIAQGSETIEDADYSVVVAAGRRDLTLEEKVWLRASILSSTFLLEDALKQQALAALEGPGSVIWFRGGLALTAPIYLEDATTQLHFQSGMEHFPMIPPLPFVHVVDGSKVWQ